MMTPDLVSQTQTLDHIMLKALLLDMDDTLCDTPAANAMATEKMAQSINHQFSPEQQGLNIAKAYVKGSYREWSGDQKARYLPIIAADGERAFRVQLLADLMEAASADPSKASELQAQFDIDRIAAFDFYPEIPDFLARAREHFCLVVITNGPELTQVPKVNQIKLSKHVDHILIGGLEPEEKPKPSIFEKALGLANCSASEAIHVGDSFAADIVGAHNSGIESVWIQHGQNIDPEHPVKPDHIIATPDLLPALIARLHGTAL